MNKITIHDHIVGEIVEVNTNDFYEAMRIAGDRCDNHNRDFYYSRRGRHLPEGAKIEVRNGEIHIVRESH